MDKLKAYWNDLKRFPHAAAYILGNEAAERFSFYGMKAILTTFLAQTFFFVSNTPDGLKSANAAANEKTHLFITAAYLCSVLGGFLADWFIGKYRTILWLSIVYCFGHLCLALFDTNLNGFMLGLMLIALGSGGIKPCVSANVGDQFDEKNKDLIPKLYDIFYFSINFGALFSQLLIPYLKEHYGASVAFGIPGILMALATFVFWLGRDKYKKMPPSGIPEVTFLGISFYAFSKFFQNRNGKSIWEAAQDKYKAENIENTKGVWRVLVVFSFIPIFWALYDQNGSEWVLQAGQMDLHFMGKDWLAEQVQSINAILILVFVPLFSIFLYPYCNSIGLKVTPLRKIGTGLVLMIITFAIIAWIQAQIDAGGKPNIGWQLLAYAVVTASEVMVSVTGLEYAYTEAPMSMKSTVMAFWLLTVSLGNYLVSYINSSIQHKGFFSQYTGASYYWFFCGVLTVTTLLYFVVAYFIKPKQLAVSAQGMETHQ
jgi:POT family proton-dependent oligopeptide transporter